MRTLRALWARLRGMLDSERASAEFAAELESHLAMDIEDGVRSGLSREEARRRALIRLGGLEQAKIAHRERRGLPWLEDLLRDVRYAGRQLRKSPGFTIAALMTLALGIGVNAGIFTLLDAILLKSLPVPQPEQLFLVRQNGRATENSRYSWPFFNRLRRQLPASSPIAAMSWPVDFYTSIGGEPPERAMGQLVSDNYFQVFETRPLLGRLFTPEDDAKLSGSAVAVISYGYWQRRFGGDPAVIGRKLAINGVPFTVVGMASRGFFGARPGREPDFWIPLTMQHDVRYHDHYSAFSAQPLQPWVPQDSLSWLQLVVRVKNPAVFPELISVLNQQCRDYFSDLAQNLQSVEDVQWLKNIHLALEPGQRGFANLRSEFGQPLLLLMGMAAMVLLIACANIANLLLARAAARRRAFSVRLSMGASSSRLIRQTLTESLLLSALGGVLGIAVAFWCTSVLPKWASTATTPIPLNLTPDARILLFSLAIALATGIVCGLAPALESTRVEPVSVLKAGGQAISGHGGKSRWPLRKALVAAQVALSLVLLAGAGMFLRTLQNYGQLDPGFDREHLLSVHLDTHLVNYQANEFTPLYQRLTDQIEAIPGIRSASVTTCSLDSGCNDSSDVLILGEDGREVAKAGAQVNSIATNYFATVGIGLVQGRAFVTTDGLDSPRVAIVNQAFARQFLGNGNAAGRRFSYADDKNNRDSFEIVGVVTDARVNSIREVAPPMIYFPIAQGPGNIDGLEIRTQGDPRWVAGQVRQAVAGVDSRIPIVDVKTLEEEVNYNLVQERLIARLTSIFGLLALGLACLGLYGVMSYIVQRRTSEIGVRLALGSPRFTVLRLVLRETVWLVGAGGLIGIALSVVAMRLARSFLFGLSPEDPAMIGGAAALLFLVSLTAGFLPAWRAASIDPVRALRTE